MRKRLDSLFNPTRAAGYRGSKIEEVVSKRKSMHTDRSKIRTEALRRDMVATGNLTIDVMALEEHFARAYSRQPTAESFNDWKRASRAFEQLAREYVRTVARYRRALKRNLLRRAVSKR
jgi:hypothetical protein